MTRYIIITSSWPPGPGEFGPEVVHRLTEDEIEPFGRRLRLDARIPEGVVVASTEPNPLAPPTFETFVEQLRLPDGQPFEPTTLQRHWLEGELERLTPPELELRARKAGRRITAAKSMAIAALMGHDIRVAAVSEQDARELIELAQRELERLGRLLGVEVGPASARMQS